MQLLTECDRKRAHNRGSEAELDSVLVWQTGSVAWESGR